MCLRAYVQFRGSEFHTRNARFRQPQEQRWAKAGFSPYIRPGAFQKRGHFFSPERAAHTSPGQRPGKLLKKILSPVRALHK